LARKPVELVVARKAARLEPPGVVEGKTTQSAAPPLELHFAAPSVQRAPPSETRTGGAASTAASTSGGPETSGGTPAGPGLGEIADSVYRIIRRRLAAERERTVGRR